MRPTDPGRDPILERFVARAAAQISVPARDAPRRRRIMLLPLLGSAAVLLLIIASALGVGRALNEARSGVASQTSSPGTPGGPVRPADLARLPWEGAVIDALGTAGLTVQTVGASKEEGALGLLLPARSFTVTPPSASGGFGRGADVVFVKDAPFVTGAGGARDAIRVCGSPGSVPGRMAYVSYVAGQRVQSSDAAAPIYHLVGADYFVKAYDAGTADALMRALGLAAAECPDRVSIGGHTHRLTAELWRDFMPVTPPGGRPLAASLMLTSEDGSALPSSITADHIWVFNPIPIPATSPAPSAERQTVLVWDTSAVETRRAPTAGTAVSAMEVVAFDGPKWDPGARVSLVLRLQVGGVQYLLGLQNVEVKATS